MGRSTGVVRDQKRHFVQIHDESYDDPPFNTLFQSLIARIATGTTYVAVDHSIYQPDNLWQHAKDDEQAS